MFRGHPVEHAPSDTSPTIGVIMTSHARKLAVFVMFGLGLGLCIGLYFVLTASTAVVSTLLTGAILGTLAGIAVSRITDSSFIVSPTDEQRSLLYMSPACLLVGGLFGAFVIAPYQSWSKLAGFSLGCMIGLLVAAILTNIAFSDAVRSPTKEQHTTRRAAPLFYAAAFAFGTYHFFTTSSRWWSVIPITLVGGTIGMLFGYKIIVAYSSRQPTQQKLATPVLRNHVKRPKKLNAIKGELKHNRQNTAENESLIQVASDLHLVGLLKRVKWLIGVTFLLVWGSVDFVNYDALLSLASGTYRLASVVIAVIVLLVYFIWWIKDNKGSLLKKSRFLVGGVAIVIWIYLEMPGARGVYENLQSGSAVPWLQAAALTGLWIGCRTFKWHYGYIAVTDKRFVIGTVMPFPIPNRAPSLLLSKLTGCEPSESALGNLFGYGKLEVDGTGQRDEFFAKLTTVPHHTEFKDALTA